MSIKKETKRSIVLSGNNGLMPITFRQLHEFVTEAAAEGVPGNTFLRGDVTGSIGTGSTVVGLFLLWDVRDA